MNQITVDQILAMEPCEGYTRKRLEKLWNGSPSLTSLQILDLPIPSNDRIWAAVRCWDLNEQQLRELACDYAERTIPVFEAANPGDTSVRDCVETCRRFARGEATLEELEAARERAWAPSAAVWAAWTVGSGSGLARRAAVATASAAAAAAAAVAAAAAWAAAGQDDVNPRADGEWQVNHLRKILKSLS